MTKEEIYEKLDTEVKLRGLSPRTCKTYKNSIGLFLDWADTLRRPPRRSG